MNFREDIGITSLTLSEEWMALEELTVENSQLINLSLPEGLLNLVWINLFKNNQLTDLILPEGLVNLRSLHLGHTPLTTLKLHKDLGKNVEAEFELDRCVLW